MKAFRVGLIAFGISNLAFSQTTSPPAGIVIPFDEVKEAEVEPANGATGTKKKKKSPKMTRAESFLDTAKPRGKRIRTRSAKTNERKTLNKGDAPEKEQAQKAVKPKATTDADAAPQLVEQIRRKVEAKPSRSAKRIRKTKKRKRRYRKRKKGVQKKKPRRRLKGDGLLNTFDTELGQLATIDYHRAIQVRSLLDGRVESVPEVFQFKRNSFFVSPTQKPKLSAMSDYIKSTPSILAVAIVGHADDSGHPREESLLSAARASAVAEQLVAEGINPARLLIYSMGGGAPHSSEAASNRVVRVEYIHHEGNLQSPSTNRTTLSLVRFSGLGRKIGTRGETELNAPMTMRAGDTVKLTTGTGAFVLPSGRLLLAESDTEFTIHSLTSSEGPSPRRNQIELKHGNIRLSTPTSKGVSSAIDISGPNYEVTIGASAVTIQSSEERLVMTVNNGQVAVRLMKGLPIFLTGGQSILVSNDGIAIHPRLNAPEVIPPSPADPRSILRWTPIVKAVGYRIEMSSRQTFDWDIKRFEQTTTNLDLKVFARRNNWFLRIQPFDEYGLMGSSSQIITGDGATYFWPGRIKPE